MESTDIAFAGALPRNYDRYLGPLLFESLADEVARRAHLLAPRRVLETAAGTGIVTEALAKSIPDADIVATDLNADMLELAAERISSPTVTFSVADALDLPFDDSSFDLVVCQLGVMFYPDKVRGNAEARRVLRDDGKYLMVVWDSIDNNPASKIAMDAVAALFSDDPPSFFYRAPHGYSQVPRIRADLVAAGFENIELETIELRSRPTSAAEAAIGICQGSPLRHEIEERDPRKLESATRAATEALRQIERDGVLDSRLTAHLVTATK